MSINIVSSDRSSYDDSVGLKLGLKKVLGVTPLPPRVTLSPLFDFFYCGAFLMTYD